MAQGQGHAGEKQNDQGRDDQPPGYQPYMLGTASRVGYGGQST